MITEAGSRLQNQIKSNQKQNKCLGHILLVKQNIVIYSLSTQVCMHLTTQKNIFQFIFKDGLRLTITGMSEHNYIGSKNGVC